MGKTTCSRICSNHYDHNYTHKEINHNNNSYFGDKSIGCTSYIAQQPLQIHTLALEGIVILRHVKWNHVKQQSQAIDWCLSSAIGQVHLPQ